MSGHPSWAGSCLRSVLRRSYWPESNSIQRTPLSRAHLDELLSLAEGGIARLRDAQTEAVGELPG